MGISVEHGGSGSRSPLYITTVSQSATVGSASQAAWWEEAEWEDEWDMGYVEGIEKKAPQLGLHLLLQSLMLQKNAIIIIITTTTNNHPSCCDCQRLSNLQLCSAPSLLLVGS